MKRYAELIGNYKSQGIKNLWDNKLVCDSDYRGEYIVALHNDSEETRYIECGDRIAQLILLPFVPMEFTLVDDLESTDRGGNGFGSTGK